MNPNLQETLNALAQKLGTTAERVYPLFVEKERLEGYIGITLSLILTVLFTAAARWCLQYREENDDGFLLGVVIIGVMAIVASIQIWLHIPKVFYPEPAAIETILKMIM
jgi:ABC-type enterobactin transport system permease subunit